jgi:RNA methyltransferase, TrmH family
MSEHTTETLQTLLSEQLSRLGLIESVTNPTVKAAKALHLANHRHEQGQVLLEGWHPLEEALLADHLELKAVLIRQGAFLPLWLSSPQTPREQQLAKAFLKGLGQAATERSFKSAHLGDRAMTVVSTTSSPPPVAAVFSAPQPLSLTQLWQRQTAEPNRLLLVLDGLQDAGNVGTLLRTAVAFNALAVVLLPNCADALSPKVLRSSAGLGLRLPVVFLNEETPEALQQLAQLGWQVVLTGAPASVLASSTLPHDEATPTTLQSTQANQPYALVLGQEGQGVRLSPSEWPAYPSLVLPIAAEVDSLNVAVCGGILMADWFREQRFMLKPALTATLTKE